MVEVSPQFPYASVIILYYNYFRCLSLHLTLYTQCSSPRRNFYNVISKTTLNFEQIIIYKKILNVRFVSSLSLLLFMFKNEATFVAISKSTKMLAHIHFGYRVRQYTYKNKNINDIKNEEK